jgi:hypothetical protein
VKAYKFFRTGAHAPISKHSWPVPPTAAEGSWLQVQGPLVACQNGLHACRIEQLSYWIADELWQVELGEEWIETAHSVVARRARLSQRIETWQGKASNDFTVQCLARAREQATHAGEISTQAQQYLKATEQFAHQNKPALTAYSAALVCSALGTPDEQMALFDSERRAQGQLLAAAVGISA